MPTVRKQITIKDYQAKYIEDNYLNLSKFVQEQLDELIKESQRRIKYV